MRAASGGPGRVGRLGWEDAEVEMEVPVRAQAQGGKNSYWSCIIKILLSGAWQSPTNPLLRTSQQRSTLLSRLLLRRLAWEELGARLAKSKARDEQGSWGGGGVLDVSSSSSCSRSESGLYTLATLPFAR